MPIRPILTVAALLTVLAAPVAAEMIYTAPTEVVAAHAELVVRARVDLETKRAEVLATYRGKLAGAIEVRNLRDFADTTEMPGALSPTADAILFLDEVDGRYHLVHTSSPAWIRPHAAILHLTQDGKVLEYGQLLSGVLQLSERKGATRKSLEKDLAAWLAKPRAARIERPSLSPAEAKRLHDLIDPSVDLHRREVVAEPHRQKLAEMLGGLEDLATEARGELRRRAIEAMLVLGQQWGPDQNRRGLAEARLVALLDRLGPEPFVDPCLDEIRSPAVSTCRRTAAKLLRRIGGEPRGRAKAILLGILAKDRRTLGTEAYYALRDLGFPAEADEALRTPETKGR